MGIFGPNLTVMERQKDIDGLLAALHHADSNIRERAASALNRLKWEPGDEDEKALYLGAKRAWEELAAMGESGIAPLIMASLHKDRKIRQVVASLLDEAIAAHTDKAVESLLWVLQETLRGFDRLASEARIQVAELLGKIGDPRAAVPLVRSFEDLFHIYLEIPSNQRKARDPILRKYRETVARVLRMIGKPAANAMVQEFQDDADPKIDVGTFTMLGLMGEPAVNALIQALKHPSSVIREKAARALNTNVNPSAVEPLITALEDDDAEVRTSAAYTLRAWRVPGAGAALAQRLRDKDHRVRVAAALALQDMGWRPADEEEMAYLMFAGFLASKARAIFDKLVGLGTVAVEPLVQSLDLQGTVYLSTWGRRSAPLERPASEVATWLLKEIGQPAVEPLIEALKHKSGTIRRNAARTLGEIKDARAKNALTNALEDNDENVREAAKAALKRL